MCYECSMNYSYIRYYTHDMSIAIYLIFILFGLSPVTLLFLFYPYFAATNF